MSLAVSRVICHCLVTEHRSHAVIIRPITRSLEGTATHHIHAEELKALFICFTFFFFTIRVPMGPGFCSSASGALTCESGCWSPARWCSGAPSAAGGCWSTAPSRWRWWPSGWSPAPARTRWNSGWRKYCALPAMRNKEINKKAKAPLRRNSVQLNYNMG